MSIAPAPRTRHTVSGPVVHGDVTVVLHSAHRATVVSERRHPNEATPLLTLGCASSAFVINDLILHRQLDGHWRAEVTYEHLRILNHKGPTSADARATIRTALEQLVGEVATPSKLWVAQRNHLYRAQEEARVALAADPDNPEKRRVHRELGAEIARHLTLSLREV